MNAARYRRMNPGGLGEWPHFPTRPVVGKAAGIVEGGLVVGWVREDTLTSINVAQFAALIYLARALAATRERLARIEGMLEGNGPARPRDRAPSSSLESDDIGAVTRKGES